MELDPRFHAHGFHGIRDGAPHMHAPFTTNACPIKGYEGQECVEETMGHARVGSGFRVQGSGSRVQGSGFKVQGSGVTTGGRVELFGASLYALTKISWPVVIPSIQFTRVRWRTERNSL